MSSSGGQNSETCPRDEELAGFKGKTLEGEARERLQNHLKTCKNCQKRLTQSVLSGIREANLSSDPALTQSPGGLKPGEPATMIAPGAATAKAKDLSKNKVSQSAQGTAKSGGSSDNPPEEYPYLDPPEEPGEMARLGMYNILRVLGSGGMGVVFDAIDRRLNRRVALKVLRPELADESYVERFKQEARLAASLSDEHIVTIFEVGVSANVPYMAMEYLHGEPLDGRLSRDGWLPVDEALNILKQAAKGLATAHGAGLVHRDIKPANLWLERNRETGEFKRVKVLDFGLAKEVAKDSNLTAAGMIVGTPSYMAPEQVYGLPCDQRTDLFALGCVLYRMVSGKLPFAGEDTMAVLQNTVDEPMPDLVNTGRSIPKKVLELLKRLLAKDPDNRPANAGLLVKQIEAVQNGGEIPSFVPKDPKNPNSSLVSKKINLKGKSSWLALASGLMALVAIVSSLSLFLFYRQPKGDPKDGVVPAVADFTGEPFKVGVLFSSSGPFDVQELPLADAVRVAVDEVNRGGLSNNDKPGVNGRKVEIVKADGASNPLVFASEAKRLVEKEGCRVIFGCWTSSCRKAVLEVLEDQAKAGRDCLLFYPMQFEGLEDTSHAVFLGMVPNQQMQRLLNFARKELLSENGGKPRKVFLVGSDYVYPRASFEVARMMMETRFSGDFEIVGEEYVPLKNLAMAEEVARKALAAKPDLIINTLNGLRVNEKFFGELRKGEKSGSEAKGRVPVVSLSLTERDLEKTEEPSLFAGDYLIWSYLSSIAGEENQRFKKICAEKMSPAVAPYDPLEAIYYGVLLWANAEELALFKQSSSESGGDKGKIAGLDSLRLALESVSEPAPQGKINPLPTTATPKALYTSHRPRVGRILKDREVEVLGAPLVDSPANPFPGPEKQDDSTVAEIKAAKEGWAAYLVNLKKAYGGQWENSGKDPVTVPRTDWWKKK